MRNALRGRALRSQRREPGLHETRRNLRHTSRLCHDGKKQFDAKMISMTGATPIRVSERLVGEFKERTLQKMRDVVCPIHRQPPRVKFHGSTIRDVSIRMSACCDTLIAIANQKIAGRDA
jgi:hypothetical protein